MNAVVSQMPAPSNIMEIISRAASDPTIDVAKVEKLMEMYERIQAKQAEAEFNAAMTACQAEMGPVAANKENKQTRSWYADYWQLDKVLRPIYTKHGFAPSFDEGESTKPDHVLVLCHLSHRGGHSRTYKKDMPADGKGAKGGDVMTKTHAAGSAMSYGMRYLLKGIFNVAIGEDDDDGNGAQSKEPLLSENQVADLKALLIEVGADIPKFLKYLKVDKLESIYAKNYSGVIKLAESKRRRQ